MSGTLSCLKIWKYQVNEEGASSFQISNDVWESLDMDNNGFVNYYDKANNVVAMLLLPHSDSRVLLFGEPKKSKTGIKAKKITANVLEKDLLAAGTIQEVNPEQASKNKPVQQIMDLVELDQALPEGAIKGFILVAKEVEAEEETVEEAPQADVQDTPPVNEVEETANDVANPVSSTVEEDEDF